VVPHLPDRALKRAAGRPQEDRMRRIVTPDRRRPVRTSRGAVNFGCIFGGLVLLVLVYLAIKFVPVKVAIAEVRDTVTSEATLASMKKDGEIRFSIMQKIRENHLPISETAIEIVRTQGEINIKFEVDVPIDLVGGNTYHYKDKIDVRRQLF
jgi:hypothetical protein